MKRILRISLRTLLIAFLVLGAGIAYVVNSMQEYRSEQTALLNILKAGVFKEVELTSLEHSSIRKDLDEDQNMVYRTNYF